MGTYSSVEEEIIKMRKPYTITKQRERWTEEEHSRFLEALKLYGRSWQRIEEHIGTKTAVQIRSHAQKFFSKLEKEALIKGVPLGQTLDINIPPPRPKRKPSKPYPLKVNAGASTSSLVRAKDGKLLISASSLYPGKQTPGVENDPPPENPSGTEKLARAKETLDEESGSEVLTLSQEAPCASISSASKSYIPTSIVHANSCTLREFVPSIKEISDQGATDESCRTVEPRGEQKSNGSYANYTYLDNCMSEASNLEKCCHNIHEKQVSREKTDEIKQPEKLRQSPTDETQANQSLPRHVPVHIVDSSAGTCVQTQSPDVYPSTILYQAGGAHLNPSLFANPTASLTTEHHTSTSMSSFHQSMPNFPPPFNPFLHNQDTYQSFLNLSSTFPSLLVPTLPQNPATHIVPSLAGSFWPCTNVEATVDSPSGTLEGFPAGHMNPSPNMVAIAAATVAAASAWWATHGMFPLCPPFHPGFTCHTAPTTAIPVGTGQVPVVNKEEKDNDPQDPPWEGQQLDPELSEAPKPQLSASKSPTLASSDSEGSSGARPNSNELKATNHEPKPAPITGVHDSTKAKTRKKVDGSSCGSNSPSNSEVEKEALEKHEKVKDESKEPDINRRSRSTSTMNESWKEVSEEGRLAFQALFSREVLPQSFSHSFNLTNKEHPKNSNEDGKQNNNKDEDVTLQLSPNCKTWEVNPAHPGLDESELLVGVLVGKNTEKEVLSIGLGHAKLKARRTGFKPYKRCSLEAKESVMNGSNSQGEENGPKRIRLEGEAST